MSRLRANAAFCVPLTVLAVLAATTARLSASEPRGECVPASTRTTAPPTDAKVRPVPAVPTATGKEPPLNKVPSAPFPPAQGNASTSRAGSADLPVPSVTVRVRVPAEVAPGQELTYQIVAENVSRGDAHHVIVRVPLPTNAKYVRATPTPSETEPAVTWKLGTLRGAEKKEIKLVVTPTGDGEIACCARVQFEHGQCVKTKLTRPGVQVKKSGPIEGGKNDLLKFKIVVTNTGKSVAKNVVVEETLPKGLAYSNSSPSTTGDNPLTWKLGDLQPGKSRTVEYDAIAEGTGSLTTKAQVTADGGVKREAGHALKIGEASLSVSHSGPAHRYVGRPATYQLTVRNNGTLPATHVELRNVLPPEIEYVSSPAGKLDRDQVKWELGTIGAGKSRTVQVTVRATKAGTFTNVGTATADRGLSGKHHAETRFDAAAGLALELDKGEEPLVPGQTTTWTVRVLNKGDASQTSVGVLVKVPDGLKATEVRGVPNATIKDGLIKLPQLATLPAGKDQAATIRLTVEKSGDHRVQAEAYSDTVAPDAAVKVEETLNVGEGESAAKK